MVPAPPMHATARLTPAVCTDAAHPSTASSDHAETSSLFLDSGGLCPRVVREAQLLPVHVCGMGWHDHLPSLPGSDGRGATLET
jgi:hypothetical protein